MEESYDPSLVPLPAELTSLVGTSVDTYSRPWITSITHQSHKGDEVCAVCLENLEAASDSDKQARELMHNCRHVFHKGCLDAWVARGQSTCPVCRAKLLGDQKQASRKERMLYLFGDDVFF